MRSTEAMLAASVGMTTYMQLLRLAIFFPVAVAAIGQVSFDVASVKLNTSGIEAASLGEERTRSPFKTGLYGISCSKHTTLRIML